MKRIEIRKKEFKKKLEELLKKVFETAIGSLITVGYSYTDGTLYVVEGTDVFDNPENEFSEGAMFYDGSTIFFVGVIKSKKHAKKLAKRVTGDFTGLFGEGYLVISVALTDAMDEAEIVVTDEESKTKKTRSGSVWNSGIRVLKSNSFSIEVPEKIFKVCRKLAQEFAGVEFSILCKATREGDVFRISEEFFIPEQEVTSGKVEFKNKAEMNGWNCIIHKHPSGLRSFSSTDDETINGNNDVSILFCDGEFVTAVANIKISEHEKIQIEVQQERIKIVDEQEIQVEGIERIKRKSYPQYSGKLGSYVGYEYAPDWREVIKNGKS